jgi:hypothetical protein
MSDAVRLTTTENEIEAEILCGMLRAEGIQCVQQPTNSSADQSMGGGLGGWREVLVDEADLDRARKLLPTQ